MFKFGWCKLQSFTKSKINSRFYQQIKNCRRKADESNFFLEILIAITTNITLKEEMNTLLKEGNEILAIIVSSIKTTRNNQNSK